MIVNVLVVLATQSAQAYFPPYCYYGGGPGCYYYTFDSDGDGWDDSIDCQPFDPLAYPGAPELVGDGRDQNCDGVESCYVDDDDDGARLTLVVPGNDLDCTDPYEGVTSDPFDCNDRDAGISPLASEIIGDGIDQDCDGGEVCYVDADNDDYRTSSTITSSDSDCNDSGEALSSAGIDCNDSNSSIHPGASEVTGDGVDQNCDGSEVCYVDADNDNYRTSSTITSSDSDCNDSGEALSSAGIDCNDSNSSIYPGASETVGDGIDQSCDGTEVCYADSDNDDYRSTSTVTSSDTDCIDSGEATSSQAIDCNDSNSSIHPGATEIVGDGIDQDCDGDELCYADSDNDDYRTSSTVASADTDCNDSGEATASTTSGDCNDLNASVYPGAPETTGDGIDADCDGGEICWADSDNDGARTTGTRVSYDSDCSDDGEGVTSDPIDCDDADASVYPGAAEVVGDGIDQDCDGDETCYVDGDGDSYRTSSTVLSGDTDCSDAGEALAGAGIDCDDSDDQIYPGASDTTADGVDSDCDGEEVCYVDDDGDGARTDTTVVSTDGDCSDAGEALLGAAIDCDDTDDAVSPGATESPADGIDTDCDGSEDCYEDLDFDGVGGEAGTIVSGDLQCLDPGVSIEATDCDDADDGIYPGAYEIPCNGIDDDCDPLTLDDPDADGDGYYACVDDCDDSNSDVNPGASEVAGDGIDNDCDGTESCYEDADYDGVGSTNLAPSPAGDCSEAGVSALDTDCDDSNPDISPLAGETTCNGIDDDCDESTSDAPDADGDGFFDCTEDCDDSNPDVNPAATEIACNILDDDCDPSTIDGVDSDGDGVALCANDCDDLDPDVSPLQEEVLCSGKDEDCNAGTEDAPDDDMDGFTVCDNDCNDDSVTVNPGFPEIVCNGIDDDCDPATIDCYDTGDTGSTADTGPATTVDTRPTDTGTPSTTDTSTTGPTTDTQTGGTTTDPGTSSTGPNEKAPPPADPEYGCGCTSGGSAGWMLLPAALAGLVLRRRG